MPSTAEERARTRHQDLVKQHDRLRMKEEKLIDAVLRTRTKRLAAQKAIVRSSKRLDKLLLATHTGGPTSSPVPAVIKAIEAPPPAPKPLDDEIPTFVRRGQAAQKAVDAVIAKVETGKAKRKARRTPDDFRVEMERRK